MDLSPGSLGVSLSHLAAIFQDLWIHSIDIYSVVDLVLSEGSRDESSSNQGSPLRGRAGLETGSEDTVR